MTRIAPFVVLMCAFQVAAQEQPTSPPDPYKLYMQVVRGERQFESLSRAEQQQVLAVQRAMVRSCNHESEQCQEACEAANSLQDAAEDLARCAARHDLSNDCQRKFRDTKSAFEQYEYAVGRIEGRCN